MASDKWVARDTGDATATAGGFANSGVITGQVTVVGRPIARSVYGLQAQRIRPQHLAYRARELDELNDFCRAADGPDYAWWRGPAWAGKSALMSWFVSYPPDGVRIVPFFVTSRWAGQSDRIAFTDVVTEQLAELLAEPMPDITPATRDLVFLDLVERAAQLCASRDERLILLVDGLDEDRGVVFGPDAHSIAALLPAPTPAGLRVIVCGRPAPPIPADVPAWHPLRNPTIVRSLEPSPLSRAIRQDMLGELHRLLYGTDLERDLIGLLTSARGGLSARDIAELTGLAEREVELNLNTVAGRSFSKRMGRWGPKVDVYVLGHEELQTTAADELGAEQLARHRQKLHDWADSYRDRSWPADTPEYLLRGYFFEVLTASDDHGRLVAYVTDSHRHHRLLERSGSDYVALAQNARARQLLFADARPDYRSLIRVVLHQSHLAGRARSIPAGLPAVWARLGRVEHAESLAQILPDPYVRVRALANVVEVCANNGEISEASRLLERAWPLLAEVTRDDLRDAVLVPLIWAAARTGHFTRADELIAQTRSNDQCIRAIALAARAALAADNQDRARHWCLRAEATVGELSEPAQQAQVLAWIAEVQATLGDSGHAGRLLSDALLRARAIVQAGPQAASLAAVAKVAASTGLLDPAAALDRAQLLADPSDSTRPFALAILAAALSPEAHQDATNLLDKAEALAHDIHDHYGQRVTALTKIAENILVLGDVDRAERLALEIGNTHDQEDALASLAACAARHGDPSTGDRLARSINTPTRRAQALTSVAWGWVDAGEPHNAQAILGEIENQARAMSDFGHALELASIATSEAEQGRYDRARTIAELIADEGRRISTLSTIARTAAANGKADCAWQLFDAAEQFAEGITLPWPRAIAVQDIASAAWMVEDRDRAQRLSDEAERLASSLDDVENQVHALSDTAIVAASAGDNERGHRLVDDIEHLVRSITEPDTWSAMRAMRHVVTAAASMGQLDRAEQLLAEISLGVDTTDLSISLARASAAAHDMPRFYRFIGRAEHQVEHPNSIWLTKSWQLTSLIDLLMRHGDRHSIAEILDRGERLARSATGADHVRRLFVKLAEAAASLGQVDRAREILAESRRLDEFTDRATETAAVLQQLGDINGRDEVVGHMLQNGDWSSAATVLSKNDPDLRTALAGDLSLIGGKQA